MCVLQLEKAREKEPSPPLAKKARIDNKSVDDTDAEKVKETKTKIDEQEDDEKATIKSKFLVDMPDDFYQFWDFCSTLNSTHPHCKQPINLTKHGLFIMLLQWL